MRPENPKAIPHTDRRVVLATLGSWGDVLPYLAVGLGLRDRGRRVILATSACYRERVESYGIDYRQIRPDSSWVADPALMMYRSHPMFGLIRVGRDWVLPALPETYADLGGVVRAGDVLVSHPLTAYAVRLVAEKHRLGWVSTMLVPLGFFSAYDRTALPIPKPLLVPLRWLGPRVLASVLWLGKRGSRFLAKPWYRLRAELGLPPATDDNPLSDSHSPSLNLALFSRVLAAPRPDWPTNTIVTGYPHSQRTGGEELPSELARFLDSGPAPLVFTLGTAVGSDPARFFETSLEATRALGSRAVFVGSGARQSLGRGADTLAVEYAPFSTLFPRASVIVHHGGIGSTSLAMRSGRPMLVVPRAWDQPDHADRVERLGIARTVPWSRYTVSRATTELARLLDGGYHQQAEEVARQLDDEDGVRVACDAIERFLEGRE